jgi:glycosyltransferase involved in cell wall biosynthesis
MKSIPVRVGVQQRVLPSYRIPFFDALAEVCPQGLGVFTGKPRKEEALGVGSVPQKAKYTQGHNYHFLKGIFYLCWQSGLIGWLRSWQPEVLIMEANPRYPNSYQALKWVRQQGKPIIGWGLGSPYPGGKLPYQRLTMRRKFVLRFDALITYSQRGAEEYASLGFSADRIFVAPNAVAPKPTKIPPKRPLAFKYDRPVVLYVGRLQARKRVGELICACGAMPEEVRPLLRVVGDGPERYDLEALAKEVYSDTKFYGALHGRKLEEVFKQADLFVLPGTGGLAVQQAMSFALPVIVAEADGTRGDLVRDENGWGVPGGNIKELTNTMLAALSNLSDLRAKGLASYRIVKKEINLEKMVAAFGKAIFSVLEG